MDNSTLKIFVLDDDMMYGKMLASYVESLGHTAETFQLADDCLVNLNHNPDLVLLDHNLGGDQKGVDVLRFIKHERPDISVIYITAEENVALVSDVFRSGSDDFIGKDSASLLRLKLKIEELFARKVVRLNRRNKSKKMLVVGALLLTVYIIAHYILMN